SATETIYNSKTALTADPYVEKTGITEDSIQTVILPVVKTAREGAEMLGKDTDAQKHELIRTLYLVNGKSLRETTQLAGISKMTVIRVCNKEED
ncbi:C69 family dipeptidase, partial [Salmonella enterica]